MDCFPEGDQNRTAINIMKNYCTRLNLNWRFGVGIGGGEFIAGSKNMPLNSYMKKPAYKALLSLKDDIENNSNAPTDNIIVNPNMPKFIYKLAGNIGWKSMAKKNNLKTKDLYKQIY